MDIEIENMLIKVASQPPQAGATPSPVPQETLIQEALDQETVAMEQLIEQCVEQVMRQLQRRAGE